MSTIATLTSNENGADSLTDINANFAALNADKVEALADLSVTSSAAELNVLDGIPVTLTATELGYVDGVTSAIQTQLNAKAASLGADDNYVTDAEKVVIGNTSGTNTGDQTSIVGITGTKAQFDTAVSDGNIMYIGDAPTAHTHTKADLTDIADFLLESEVDADIKTLSLPASTTITAFGATLTDDADAATARTTLELGTAATKATDLADLNEATIEGAIDTLTNLTSVQGRTITLADAGADAILGWDDSASAYENLTQAEVLAVIGDSTSTAKGVVELAIDSEAVTGTDTARAVTPANLTARMAAPGTIGGTTPGAATFTTATINTGVTLGENASVDLDPSLSADGKYSGICITGTAGAALAFGDLIYLAVADSRWELADADAATTADRMLGICVLAAAGDASATKILLHGNIRADAVFPALTIGAPVYVGETAGDVQVAIPTGADNIIRRVGYALTADSLFFAPSMDSQVTVA